MYVVVEYALLLSLLLPASVAFVMVHEGVATVWRVSRRMAGNERR
jgi:hypothetical protein